MAAPVWARSLGAGRLRAQGWWRERGLGLPTACPGGGAVLNECGGMRGCGRPVGRRRAEPGQAAVSAPWTRLTSATLSTALTGTHAGRPAHTSLCTGSGEEEARVLTGGYKQGAP